VLRLIRLTRITRIFKMSKSFQGIIMLLTTLRKSATALLMLFAFMGVFSLLFATLIYTFEMGEYDEIRKQYVRPDGSRSPYESIPTSMWWTIVTMTTVGYGDQFPVTELGKLVAVFTMFSGLIVLSLPITIIGANFDSEYREFKKAKQEELERKRRARRAQEEAAEAARRAAEQLSPDGPKKRLSGLGSLLLPTAPSTPKKEGASAQPPTPGSVAAKKEEAEKKDPIKIIQTIIHESNYQLLAEIDELLERHEIKLRAQVKDVLRRHAAGIDERPTPLDPKIIVPKGT
jgi:voltage-gated potassium channel Kch